MRKLEILADQVFETDVLILGGGMGGCMAAINAAEHGARVLIVDKGALASSGSGGMYPWTVHLVPTDQQSYDEALRIEKAAVDGMVHRPAFQIFYEDLLERVRDLERWGVEMVHEPNGNLKVYSFIGLAHAFLADPVGKGLKPLLPNRALAAGAQAQEWTMSTDLLLQDGRVVGAIGLDIRTGALSVFRAKATILATGTGARLYAPLNGQPYLRWHCPYCTGDGHTMAYRAGAELANMEFPCSTIIVKGVASPRAIALLHIEYQSTHLINGLGERFMSRYDPEQQERTARNVLCHAILSERRAGRGPIFVDTRGLSESAVRAAWAKWNKKRSEDHLVHYLRAQGIELGRDLIEVDVSEPSLYNGGVSGCIINEQAATTVPGLYAVGDVVSGTAVRGIVGALATGWRAGAAAAEQASGMDLPPVYPSRVAWEQGRIRALENPSGSFTPRQVESRLNQVMSDYVAHMRTEGSLRLALGHIDRLRSRLGQISAPDIHGIQKALELENLLDCGEMVARAALFRTESRCVPFHYRADYPERDDQNWLAAAVIKKVDGRMSITRRPIY